MAQQAQGQFGYQAVQVIKTKQLGTGSYGAVYKAKCDDLPCAAKILHPTLFQSNDPGAMTVMRRFEQECSFLSAVRHPNIVQYLGSYQDPETQLPVLLMELMDESLTQFLERSQEPLLHHKHVDLCHDIALALSYLHSNDIIHRDLSSNNVLLIGAGYRAKVTDFGMAKLFDVNRSTLTPLTMCPGTLAYMSPEALDDPPVYTKKLDCFSFGVLAIQIITQQFPDPGPRTMKVQDPRSPTGRIAMPVLETERRKSHIDLISSTHPLLPIATDCLSYNEDDRPSTRELCHRLAELTNTPALSATAAINSRERQIRELQQEKEELQQQQEEHDQQIGNLQQQLQDYEARVQEKDTVIAARQEDMRQLRQEFKQMGFENHQQMQEKDCVIAAKETKLKELNQQLAASKQEITPSQQLQGGEIVQGLQKEVQYLRQELQRSLTANDERLQLSMTTELNLSWEVCKPAPCRMKRGSTRVHGSTAYFKPKKGSQVLAYNLATEEWSTLPECPSELFTLAVVNGLVTAVGGTQPDGKPTNTLLSLMDSEAGKRKWVERFPPMPTRRYITSVVCSGLALVVAGGVGEGNTKLATVEVMDSSIPQWSTACSLPNPLSSASAIVCGDSVYLVGGFDQYAWTKSAFTCVLSSLLQQSHDVKTKSPPVAKSVWFTIAEPPLECSTCVTLNGQILAVGGFDELASSYRHTSTIHAYNTAANSWNVISHMPTPQSDCLVVVLPGNKLMVVGGSTDHLTDEVVVATVN